MDLRLFIISLFFRAFASSKVVVVLKLELIVLSLRNVRYVRINRSRGNAYVVQLSGQRFIITIHHDIQVVNLIAEIHLLRGIIT